MRLTEVAGAAVLAVACSAPAVPAQERQAPSAAPPQQGSESTIDVSKLPLDLARIERELRQQADREEFEGMRLRTFVDVFGRAPQIQFFTPGENLDTGPVPWGAPTHQQMLDIMTPREFREPTMDFANFLRWLREKTKD